MKKLYRSDKNKMLAGVCGGIAEYYNLDPTLIRVFSVIGIILTGLFPGVIIYVALAILMPRHAV
jgi:phage shock protein C